MIERINSDLANILGNLVNRTIGMANKYFDGVIENRNVCEDIDKELVDLVLSTKNLVEDNMDLPEGITTYDENNLSKVVVPEIAQGKAVYLSGRGPNYLTVAIAEAYAHTNSSVSLFQPGVGYTCSITHSRSKGLGDLTKDPLGKEEVKEQLKKIGSGEVVEVKEAE